MTTVKFLGSSEPRCGWELGGFDDNSSKPHSTRPPKITDIVIEASIHLHGAEAGDNIIMENR